MKLSYEDKLTIYKLKKQGMPWIKIGKLYDVNISNIKYMVRLMTRYGIEIVKKSKIDTILLNSSKKLSIRFFLKGILNYQFLSIMDSLIEECFQTG